MNPITHEACKAGNVVVTIDLVTCKNLLQVNHILQGVNNTGVIVESSHGEDYPYVMWEGIPTLQAHHWDHLKVLDITTLEQVVKRLDSILDNLEEVIKKRDGINI